MHGENQKLVVTNVCSGVSLVFPGKFSDSALN
jgi:hypothetical protein